MSKKGGFFNRTPHWKKSRGGWGSEAILKIVKKQKPHKNKKLHKGNKIIAHDCTLQGSLSCCCSGPKSCPAVCNPIDCSTQASLSLTISQSLPKFMSIESVMLSTHLILCRLFSPFILSLSQKPIFVVIITLLLIKFTYTKVGKTVL